MLLASSLRYATERSVKISRKLRAVKYCKDVIEMHQYELTQVRYVSRGIRSIEQFHI